MSSNLHPIFVALGATPAQALGSVGGQSNTGDTTILGTLASSGAHTALTVTGTANTGVTASTEAPDVLVNMARTVTWATGALTDQRAVKFMAPTYAAVAASTFTRAATVYISAAPTAGTNVTITNAYALWVDAGAVRLDGNLGLNGTAPTGQGAAIADLAAFTDPPSAVEMAALRTTINTLLAYLRLRGDIAAA